MLVLFLRDGAGSEQDRLTVIWGRFGIVLVSLLIFTTSCIMDYVRQLKKQRALLNLESGEMVKRLGAHPKVNVTDLVDRLYKKEMVIDTDEIAEEFSKQGWDFNKDEYVREWIKRLYRTTKAKADLQKVFADDNETRTMLLTLGIKPPTLTNKNRAAIVDALFRDNSIEWHTLDLTSLKILCS